MDIKEARETAYNAYNWIEETFIDKLVSGNEENNDEYNLAEEYA